MTGMHAWCGPHPTATLRVMENAWDARWAKVRAPMRHAIALQRGATAWTQTPIAAHPTGPDCGATGEARGTPARDRHTHGGQTIALERNAVGTDRWDAVWAAIARNSAGRWRWGDGHGGASARRCR